MTQENRYLRPHLAANSKRLADPRLLVDTWVEEVKELQEAMGRRQGGPRPEDVFGIIAAHGRLGRVRPELIAQLDSQGALEWTEAQLGRLAPSELRAAAAIFDPDKWLQQAQRFERSYDDWSEATDPAEWAQRLVSGLDDAELVVCLLQDKDLADDRLADKVAECCAWLVDHADLFLVAGAWVQAVGQAMRPDLVDFHPGLALTAEKLVALLDQLEASQREMTYADVPPMGRELIEALWRESSEQLRPQPVPGEAARRGRRAWWLPPVWQPPVAGAAESVWPEFLQPLRWRSPDGAREARLVLPVRPERGEAERVRLTFHHLPDGARAADLAGTPVKLASVPGTVGEDGSAEFELGQLRAADAEPTLEVGREGQAWSLLTRREGQR